MKLTRTTLALTLASAGFAIMSPANAQYGAPAAPQRPPSIPTKGEAEPPQADQNAPKITSGARKEIIALQTAVNAKDAAAIPAALAAAQAKAKSKDDNYVIAKLQLRAAVDANDINAMAQGIDAVLASGFADPSEQAILNLSLGKIHYNNKAYDKAVAAFENVLRIDPNNFEAMETLAYARSSMGQPAEGVALLQRAIATRVAAGQKPEETWYKRALKMSYDAKLPGTPAIAREWVTAYPSPKNWRDAIIIYQTNSGLEDAALIDSMRLARALHALQGENDYYRYTNTLVLKGFPGEAKAVLDEGFASNAIDKSRATFSQLYSVASARSQGDRASLDTSAKTALAAATARQAMVTAEAYYGYGDYQKAADLFRAALDKQGVDKDLANLRLGMALARAGDKAGANAALNAAGGAQAEVAKLWLIYVATAA